MIPFSPSAAAILVDLQILGMTCNPTVMSSAIDLARR